jgi:hypothetical protein
LSGSERGFVRLSAGSKESSMKRFWMSWFQPTEDHRPLTYPPNAGILGWWCSGQREDGAWTLCALVQARWELPAKIAVRKDWPEATEWRFVREVASDFSPGDRFPLSDWMKERMQVSA